MPVTVLFSMALTSQLILSACAQANPGDYIVTETLVNKISKITPLGVRARATLADDGILLFFRMVKKRCDTKEQACSVARDLDLLISLQQMLWLQTVSYGLTQFQVGLGQIRNHTLLDWLPNVH